MIARWMASESGAVRLYIGEHTATITAMNKALAVKVHSIAEEVRHWAEELARKRGRHDGFDLNGYCAIASAELYKRLTAAGVKAELHLASLDMGSHVFVVCEDHIVDVTATQFYEFRNQHIVILHVKEAEEHWFYCGDYVFNDPKKLRKAQIKWGWPQDQVVFAR